MIYTVIYTDQNDLMGTFTFVSNRHNKDYAWAEFIEKYAKEAGFNIISSKGGTFPNLAQDLPMLIKEHAKEGGFPANKISAVKKTIDPTTSE